jgi:hypothetical protein
VEESGKGDEMIDRIKAIMSKRFQSFTVKEARKES